MKIAKGRSPPDSSSHHSTLEFWIYTGRPRSKHRFWTRAVEGVSRTSTDDSKQWWRLLPKPPTFEHTNRESEMAAWREWSWAFEQYVASVDAKFADDIEQLRANPNQAVDPVDFTDTERQRNHFLYSLLSSLLRQRPLLVVRNLTGSNGLEAYRMLIQQNEPVSKNRSMGLLNVIMNWPAFTGKLSLMQQLLRLEHAFAEYEKLGTKLNEDLKTAILMRSLTGQLKVWLQLQVNESTTYAKVREMVLLYDSSTTKWSEQMVLGTDSAMSAAEGPVPMEIDRVQSKGKSKGSKGKSKIIQRESQKEKERTKMEKEKESLQIRIRRVQRETQFAKRSIQGQRKRRLKSMLRMWAHWSHG